MLQNAPLWAGSFTPFVVIARRRPCLPAGREAISILAIDDFKYPFSPPFVKGCKRELLETTIRFFDYLDFPTVSEISKINLDEKKRKS
jgi:hypothetical protein